MAVEVYMEEIFTENAPAGIAPYSQAIKAGNRVYVSGQGPTDPNSGEIIEGDIQAETARTLENIDAILRSAGNSLDDVVKSTLYFLDINNYDKVNETYEEYMSAPYPSRTAVEVADLPVNIEIEIDVIAYIP